MKERRGGGGRGKKGKKGFFCRKCKKKKKKLVFIKVSLFRLKKLKYNIKSKIKYCLL